MPTWPRTIPRPVSKAPCQGSVQGGLCHCPHPALDRQLPVTVCPPRAAHQQDSGEHPSRRWELLTPSACARATWPHRSQGGGSVPCAEGLLVQAPPPVAAAGI